jgi:hypothetical protein
MASAERTLPVPPVASPASSSDQFQDALVVARGIFQEFGLTEVELQKAATSLAVIGGGLEYAALLTRAKKKPEAPWDTVDAERREFCLTSAMNFHCSAADRERMALRTGAGLLLTGEAELGRKILQAAPDASFGVEAGGVATWVRIGQLSIYTFVIALLAVQSALTGLYVFLVAGIAVVGVAALFIWLVERNRWKLEREEHEARHYLDALLRMDRGAPAKEVFAPDGTLRGPPS